MLKAELSIRLQLQSLLKYPSQASLVLDNSDFFTYSYCNLFLIKAFLNSRWNT